MPPLLLRLSERKPETLDYLGVSYGLTPQLLRRVYLRSSLVFADALCAGFGKGRAMYHCIFARQRVNSPVNTLASWFVG